MDNFILCFYDNDRTLAQKIVAAANWYTLKRGTVPNVAYVNAEQYAEEKPNVSGIRVVPATAETVREHYVYVGVEEERE